MNRANGIIALVEVEKNRIINKGMGGAFSPPGHPEHDKSVETDLSRRPQNRGGMALSYALQHTYVDDETKQQIKDLLGDWEKNKRPLSDPLVQNWVADVMKHFGDEKGYEFILKYYPDFKEKGK